MHTRTVCALFAACLTSCIAQSSKTVFLEKFDDGDAWESRWIQSEHKSDYGKFVLDSGKFYGDVEKDKGIKTSQDARFYALSTKFDEAFDNKDKTLVVQFSVKHEQNIDCGGGYLKLFDCTVEPKDFNGDSSYKIMFGPDICGPGTRKVHVILNYKGENKMIKKDIRAENDEFTHLYRLEISPDNTYKVYVDDKEVEGGNLEDDFDFLLPKKIKDPEAKKPEDWDDRPKIDDPEDTKPDDWDVPEHVTDPDATKPEDWDDEMDGEWEPPMIDNPEYKGEWKPKQIDNPNYKGIWIHPEIPNPDYVEDPELYNLGTICGLGFDLSNDENPTAVHLFPACAWSPSLTSVTSPAFRLRGDWSLSPSHYLGPGVFGLKRPEPKRLSPSGDSGPVLRTAEKEMREKQKAEEEEKRKAEEAATQAEEDEEEDEDLVDDAGSVDEMENMIDEGAMPEKDEL
ncbi:unnamed protein product [Cyprideis torosa]|uniref:Calreticulin n=1 Tax=Cyprideis torosa TaxID=163714 RepID=A0A7R8W8T9_9CRUS|nr:unnamed protein product [Cyprideis torosa]CAG0888938.1 unnamed protein product [Cyprideis torosa]